VVARHRSRPLREYVALVNKESHNLTAEALLKTMGRVVEGEGSFAGGARVLERFLHDELGVTPQTAVVVDGSGLAASNRLTPGVLVALLGHMAGGDLWDPYWESLPEAGNRRELSRMYRTAAAGNLRAKTGTVTGVSALSGVVRSTTGERIAFSIIGNHVPSTWSAKRIEDRLGVRLASFDRPRDQTTRPARHSRPVHGPDEGGA
jgi:D-alanyl-D-alanine carboxypeptidase/D-alanyl-D-alanine-endopeptidase (penicillin-binding protein 4)